MLENVYWTPSQSSQMHCCFVQCVICIFDQLLWISQVRLNFLNTLMGEAYSHLHNTMCASVLGRKLFTMPFHRDVDITAARAQEMHASINLCQQVNVGPISSWKRIRVVSVKALVSPTNLTNHQSNNFSTRLCRSCTFFYTHSDISKHPSERTLVLGYKPNQGIYQSNVVRNVVHFKSFGYPVACVSAEQLHQGTSRCCSVLSTASNVVWGGGGEATYCM